MTRVEFDSTKKPLDDLLKKARDGLLQLPDFQRGWVWDDDGLKGLLTSISRSFPVGAIMTLQTGGEVRFKPRLVEGAPEENTKVVPEALILDGQQRITSLYQTTMRREVVETINSKKQRIKRFFYIDMAKALDDSVDRAEAIIGVPENKKETRNFGKEIVRDLSTEEQEYAQCMFPTNRIFDADAWQMGFFKFWKDELADKADFWFKFQNEVLAAFRQYQMPVIQLGNGTSREAVCLVFEKVNTGGKKLDAFELLTAIYAGEEEGFLLRERWAECAKRLSESIALRDHPLTRLQPTEFFQALALLHTLDRRKEAAASNPGAEPPPVTCTRETVLGIPLAAYKKHSSRLEEGFKKAGRFLFSQHIYWFKDVPYQSQIVPLAAILAELGDKWEFDAVRSKLAQWYWCGVFGELYGGAIETRFAKDLIDMLSWTSGGPEPTTVKDAAFRAERLDTMTSRLSAAYKGVHALLMKEGARDFRSGQPFNQASYFEEAVDIHHVFPRAWCEKSKIPPKHYDTIVNKTPLSYKTNRAIGGDAPSRYLAGLSKQGGVDDKAINDHLRSHLINPDLLRGDNFDGFIEARREALLTLIERVMGKVVYRGEPTDEPEGEIVVDEAEAMELA
ncbi:GmrSD restriction endonuclease domain-containing protein [Methylocystis sp. JAN1]|uniref:GmrSD restriction endonuclease domain-containing protein n=1 Tax=Methylocystis sp. JAN1 TaxID=3397211 RepID=UPI003FA2A36D